MGCLGNDSTVIESMELIALEGVLSLLLHNVAASVASNLCHLLFLFTYRNTTTGVQNKVCNNSRVTKIPVST